MKTKRVVVLLTGLIALSVAHIGLVLGQQPHKHSHNCVLVTKNMCCAHESVPAIKELSKVPGVARVTADHKTRSLTIIPKDNAMVSPLALWEAAEKANLQTVKLQTAHGVYNTKPKIQR